MIVCKVCGTILNDDADFCMTCGAKVDENLKPSHEQQTSGAQEKKQESSVAQEQKAKSVQTGSSKAPTAQVTMPQMPTPQVSASQTAMSVEPPGKTASKSKKERAQAVQIPNNPAQTPQPSIPQPYPVPMSQMQPNQFQTPPAFVPQPTFVQPIYPIGAPIVGGYPNEISAPQRKKTKRKKLKIIIGLILIAVVIGATLFLLLKKSEAERIASAFRKTLNAESFAFEGSASYGRYYYDFNGEIIGNKSDEQLYFSYESTDGRYDSKETESIAYINGKLYYKWYNSYWDEYHYDEETDNERVLEFWKEICHRDVVGAVKSDKEIEDDVKETVRNYDEVPDILTQMLKDCMELKGDVSFIKSMERVDKNNYIFVVDANKFVKAGKKEYGVKYDSAFYDDVMYDFERYDIRDVELKITIEKGYLSEITAEVKVGKKTAEFVIKFERINDVEAKNSSASAMAEEVKKYVR